jgi:DNA repair protein RadC
MSSSVICDLPRDDRPRERMMMHGAETLSDAELVAIFIGSGRRGRNAVELARDLMSEGMARLARREMQYLTAVDGIGMAKAARIVAAFELARRIQAARPDEPDVFDTHRLGTSLVTRYGRHMQERLGAVLLDSRHRIMKQKEIFVGTINSALVSTSDIVRFALIEHGTAVVVFHNHPSGNPAPSGEDESFTQKLRFSLSTCDIELVDHLIIGAHGYFSMKEKGMI